MDPDPVSNRANMAFSDLMPVSYRLLASSASSASAGHQAVGRLQKVGKYEFLTSKSRKKVGIST